MSVRDRLRRVLADPGNIGPILARHGRQLGHAGREQSLKLVEAVRERIFSFHVQHVSGPESVDAATDEAVVVCLVRDGAEYLDGFLAHYRALGVRHVVFLDNGSTDGTVERAGAEPDVTVLRTAVPYKKIKVIAKRYLIQRFGKECWALCVDIDELFDYPRRDAIPLRPFLRYLNEHRYTAVVAYLLDMFPRGPLAAGTDWRRDHRFYSLEALGSRPYHQGVELANEPSNPDIRWYAGGVRKARFGLHTNLTKHPLQFPSGGVRHLSSHRATGARVADVSCVLLHYKYASGFLDYAERLVTEKSFFNGSAEYVQYLDAIQDNPSFRMDSPESREFYAVGQLVDEGFLAESDAYVSLAGRLMEPASR